MAKYATCLMKDETTHETSKEHAALVYELNYQENEPSGISHFIRVGHMGESDIR